MSIQDTLKERGKTHGLFTVQAALSQDLKTILLGYDTAALSQQQREAIDMILHKISRIVAGNPNFHDHWHDIIGYATLILNQLEKEEGA